MKSFSDASESDLGDSMTLHGYQRVDSESNLQDLGDSPHAALLRPHGDYCNYVNSFFEISKPSQLSIVKL